MDYNQISSEIHEVCITDNGLYCVEWEKQVITTYNYFDFIALLGIPLTLYVVYRLFKRNRRRR